MKKKVVSAVASVALLSSAYAGAASASTYTVQKGDTLSYIASKYQTSVPNLKKVNNLSSDLIFVNQVLKLDAAEPAPAAPASAAPTAAIYTVVSGDTLSAIAYRYGISVADLMSWNHLTSSLIFPGNQLKVASASAPTSPVVAPTAPVTAPVQTAAEYTIKSGDTLGVIALQFGCTVSDLKQLNGLTSDLIFAGQTLKVAKEATVTTPVQAAPAVPVTTTAAAPATSNYIVESGDTLGRIAAQFDTTVSSIKKLNNLSTDLIYVGQALKITGQAVPTTSQPSLANLAANVISVAKSLMGIPYVWGGSSMSGFDCSGFIYYVFNKAGYSTTRTTAAGFYDRSYYVNNPQPGDLVFFQNTYQPGITHVGIYLGDNQFIHADENRGIAVTNLSTSNYFKAHFDSFKRFY